MLRLFIKLFLLVFIFMYCFSGMADVAVPYYITLTFAGDCTLGGQIGSVGSERFESYFQEFGSRYFFENVSSIFKNDDFTVVNLEGPLTESKSKRPERRFNFKGSLDYVSILKDSSVEVCNFANNHSLDYGRDGFDETIELLCENNIGVCAYDLKYVHMFNGLNIGFFGITGWDYDIGTASEYISKFRKQFDLLIVNVHWGVEKVYMYNQSQQNLAHALIDSGADLVIGTHPHVCQGIEKYKGKYIVYSLGNFCFGGNSNPSDKRCYMFQQQFRFLPGVGLVKQGLTDMGINVVPCWVSSVSGYNDFKPTVMAVEDGTDVLNKLWKVSPNLDFDDVVWMEDSFVKKNINM